MSEWVTAVCAKLAQSVRACAELEHLFLFFVASVIALYIARDKGWVHLESREMTDGFTTRVFNVGGQRVGVQVIPPQAPTTSRASSGGQVTADQEPEVGGVSHSAKNFVYRI